MKALPLLRTEWNNNNVNLRKYQFMPINNLEYILKELQKESQETNQNMFERRAADGISFL